MNADEMTGVVTIIVEKPKYRMTKTRVNLEKTKTGWRTANHQINWTEEKPEVILGCRKYILDLESIK